MTKPPVTIGYDEPSRSVAPTDDVRNIEGFIATTADAPTGVPRSFWQQFRIYNDAFYWYNTFANAWQTFSAALAAGSDTQIQFNDGGSELGGSQYFTFDKTSRQFTFGKVGSGHPSGWLARFFGTLQIFPDNLGSHSIQIVANGLGITTTATVQTTSNSFTTLAAISMLNDTSMLIEARIVGRRTGGSAGSIGDTACYVASAAFKKTTGGGIAQVGSTATLFSAESNAACDFQFSTSGSNPILQVKGDTNNDYTWDVYLFYYVNA